MAALVVSLAACGGQQGSGVPDAGGTSQLDASWQPGLGASQSVSQGTPSPTQPPADTLPLTFRIVDLGVLGGMTDMHATAVNRSGQVVGYGSVGGSRRAFLWDEAVGLRDLGLLPGAGWSAATAISNDGIVVGNTSEGPFVWRWSGGMAHLLDDPQVRYAFVASGINDRGIVVGSYHGYASMWHPDSGISQIPGNWRWDMALDINDAGAAVGHTVRLPEYGLPVLWDLQGGRLLLVPDLPGCAAFSCVEGAAQAINESGEIAGTLRVTDPGFDGASPPPEYVGRQRAFRWSPVAGLTVLGTLPTGPDSAAVGIDASGRVYGSIAGAAAVWTDGSAMQLGALVAPGDPLSWIELNEAIGGDDSGRIVVNAFVSGSGKRVVMLLPES
jgi:probable HAF family extracellular repeat protein